MTVPFIMHSAIVYKEKCPKEIAKYPFIFPASFEIISGKSVIAEVGPGRGDFLFYLAEQNPDSQVVGIEIKSTRVDKLIERVENKQLRNIAIIQDDARNIIPYFFLGNPLHEIHVNFPDPWPKRKHLKNRAVSLEFLQNCSKALKAGGTISIITDHEPYALDIAKYAAKVPALKSEYPQVIITKKEAAFPTYFALKWISEGRTIYHQKYTNLVIPE